jgi:hypothetical protein
MWGLWWTKWHWGKFSPSTSVSPANSHSTKCSILIYHLGLVPQPKYQMNSGTPHPTKLKNNWTKPISYATGGGHVIEKKTSLKDFWKTDCPEDGQ